MRRTLTTASADETAALGAEAARSLRAGDVVVLHGEVGAGKTTFVRGAARALGVDRPVTSPTFTIGRRYEEARPPVAHVDLHRVASLDEEEPELLADYLNADHVAFVEWPEAAGGELRPRLRVRLEHAGGDRRRVELEWTERPPS
ncbi:MAG TPA: tRNA (adenosine(37)-N6)-threonylcarbamoyltransferase complex ATPase subunit type 1 TsaE [Solirubrobacteraceae bacterium]|jgi:tRNA threonylcarbamoyladenosine biosynthesis protein TsaE|nr:tRNA (adenosine(37)-N6)-threonylcarbamoyltransferase complex ATPase subunit type 1 TsaE [Solirubrobacteraceae bacterium]